MFKFLLVIFLAGVASQALGLSANEIMKKADEMRFIDTDLSFVVEVNDIKGKVSQKTKYKVSARGSKMSLVETIFPERQAGRKLLMKNDDLWFFTPDIKRATRVSMQQKLTGEVSNGDIARTNFGDDYEAEIKGEEKIAGKDCIHLALKKNREEVTYPAIEYWVTKKNFVPVKAIFKTDGGKSLKSAEYLEPKKYLNKLILTKIEITSALNKTQKSILTFSNYKKENLDDSFFNKESLNN